MQKRRQAVVTTDDVVEEVAVKAQHTEPVDTSATDAMLDKIEAALEDADTTGPIERDLGSVEDLGDLEPSPLDALFALLDGEEIADGFAAALGFILDDGYVAQESECDTCPCGFSQALCHRNVGVVSGIHFTNFAGGTIALIN